MLNQNYGMAIDTPGEEDWKVSSEASNRCIQ